MSRCAKLRYKLTALAVMVLGSSMVFATMLMMNEFVRSNENGNTESTVSFNVERQKQKEKKVQKIKRKKVKPRKQRHPVAPLPSLDTDISGIRIGIPELDAGSMGGLASSLLGDMDGLVMTDASVDNRPAPRSRGIVDYPAHARANNIEGYVTLNILVGRDGTVKAVKVLEASPAGVFEQAAVIAVKNWVFEPAIYKGAPVEIWARQTIRFNLS